MITLHSFWKEKLVYKAEVKGYKVKIYIMEDEFEQKFNFPGDPVFIWVSISKHRKTTDFCYVIPHEDYLADNFSKPIICGREKWRRIYGDRKSISL